MDAQQDKELSSDPVEVATRVFSAVYFNADAFGDESLEDQMRRAMRSALLSVGFDPTSPQLPVTEQPAGQAVAYPIRYVLTDADHLAACAESFLAYLNEHADPDECTISPDDSYGDHAHSIRSAIYEFRKRRDRYNASVEAAPHSPVAQTSGDENHVLHVLRNPFGFSYGEVRAARLRGADLIERYRNAYINMRDFAEANGLDTKARNQ